MTTPRPIIVGTGIAGLWTAWRLAAEGRPSRLVTKGLLADSASAWAQGGIAVALGPDDSPSQHAADTLAAGDGLSDPEAVRILTNEGPDRIRELLALGAIFDRGPDGSLRFGLEAAHNRPRIIHAGGDRTGAAIVAFLTDICRRHPLIEILRYTEVASVGVRAGGSRGSLAIRRGTAVRAAGQRRRPRHRRRGSALRRDHQPAGRDRRWLGPGLAGGRRAARSRVSPVPSHRPQAARASIPRR